MSRDMRKMRRYMRKSIHGKTRERPGIVGAAAGIFWTYRSELAPIYTMIVLTFSASVGHRLWNAGVIILVGLFCQVGGSVAARRYDRRSERGYARTVLFLGCGWWVAGAIAGPGHAPLPTILLLGGACAAIPWWAHRRRRSRVRVERTIRAWPVLAEDAGLAGSRVMSAVVDAFGYTARVALRRGMSARTAIGRADEIASMLGVRPNSVRVTADPDREDHVIVRVTESDPLARVAPWPGHADITPLITRPIPLGVAEDGTVVAVSLLRRHALIGGVVGSGKSGLVNAILASLVPADDVRVWGIDLKGGMELGPWEKALGRLATTPEEAVTLLSEARDELTERARDLAARAERTWHPTSTRQALVILIDEFAELPAEALDIIDSIARLGRAVAVTLVIATQRPTQEVMGNGATRSQMDVRVALRVRERGDTDLILGSGAYKSGWRTDGFTLAGAFLVLDPEHTTPLPNRAYLITDDTVASIVEKHVAPIALPPAPDKQHTEQSEDPQRVLWTALIDAGPDGMAVRDLVTATGRSRRWVYYALQQLQAAGRVEPIDGRWRAAGDDTHE
ncbi:cell division protein FtsK [Frankia sp. B2]|nr:cell division protein FtsK [Frankia sp. B2]